MNSQEAFNLLKQLATLASGILVSRGVIDHDQATSLVSDVSVIVPAFVGLCSIAWSVYAHWNMKKVPETSVAVSAPSDAPKGSVVTGQVVGALLLGFFLIPHHADAQGVKLTGNVVNDFKSATAKPSVETSAEDFGAQFRKLTKEVVDKAIADVQAASADADKRGDIIAKPCWDANLKFLQMLPSEWDNPPTEVGIALGIQVQRDLINSITGQDATSLKVACAPLWGDQLKIVTQIGALLGIRIATGGLL